MFEPKPYYQAARFPTKTASDKPYTALQQILHDEECELSCFRYFVTGEKKWYVVVVGLEPNSQLNDRLKTILITLGRGEPVTLEEDTITFLFNRRVEQVKQGPWVERHYS